MYLENLNNKQRETRFFVPTFSGIPAREIISAYEEFETNYPFINLNESSLNNDVSS